MASNWIIPKRYLRLKLFSGRRELKETKLLSDLDVNTKISFEVNSTISGASNTANITITGLTREKMAHLATTYTNWVNFQSQGSIVLDIGYENLHGTVFDGDIRVGTPNLDTENYNIRLQCMEGWYDTLQKPESYSFESGKLVSEIASEIASDNGLVFINQLENDVETSGFLYEASSVYQQIRALSAASGCLIWISNGRLYIRNKGSEVKEKPTLVIDINNMIGTPEPTEIGCKVKIRLNPSVYVGQVVKLNSLKFPTTNSSDWFVQQVVHTGDTKGTKWQTELLLSRGGYGFV